MTPKVTGGPSGASVAAKIMAKYGFKVRIFILYKHEVSSGSWAQKLSKAAKYFFDDFLISCIISEDSEG